MPKELSFVRLSPLSGKSSDT